MADATRTISRHPKRKKKPPNSGNLKLCCRPVLGNYENPLTIYSDARHKGDFYKELKQLMAAKDRTANKPKYGGVSWAAIYDCSEGWDRGPKKYEFFLDRGEWIQIVG